jgi:serine/threonine protein kinase/WD40 repeat protein
MPDANPSPKPDKGKGDVAATADSPSDVFGRNGSKKSSDKIPRQFGRYLLQDCLGKGGMGAVFKAHDTQLDRQVALKVPFLSSDDEETRQRFYREARAAATLQHAYICPVFDVGEFKGTPYLTMAFIEGRSLGQALKSGQNFPPGQTALLIRKLALAMQEAHSKGVVHRDLKPANVILRPNGEPVIMDFGLARRADDKHNHGLTREGDIIGTLDYMSPEQVEGDNTIVGPPADIYALGLILYELLCGKRPFEGNTASLLMQIVSKQPTKPGDIRIGVPQKLEEICLKAIAKKPDDRFADMGQFAAALADFLRNPQLTTAAAKASPSQTPAAAPLPASATETTETAVTAKTRPRSRDGMDSRSGSMASGRRSGSGLKSRSGRRKGKTKSTSMMPVIVGAATVALLVIGAVVGAVLLWPKDDKNPKAIAESTQPQTSTQPINNNNPVISNNDGTPNVPPTGPTRRRPIRPPINPGTTVDPNNPQQMRPMSAAGFSLKVPAKLPALAVGQREKITVKVERRDYQGPVNLSWSASKELRVFPSGPVTIQANQTEVVLTLFVLNEPSDANLRLEFKAVHESEPQRADVTVALETRADASGPCMRVIELPTRTNFSIQSIVFAPDMTVAVIGGGTPKRDTSAGSDGRPPIPPIRPGGGGGRGNRNGQQPGVVDDPNALQICDLKRGEIIASLVGHKDRIKSISVSADSKSLLSTSADDTMALWDLAQGKLKFSAPMPRASFATMSPDGKRALVVLPGYLAKVNLETFKVIGQLVSTVPNFGSQPDAIRTAAYSDERKEILGGLDGKLYLVTGERGKAGAPKPLNEHSEAVLSSIFSPSGDLAATGGGGVLRAGSIQQGKDNAVRLWDVTKGSVKWTGQGHEQSVVALNFSPSGKLLASGSMDGVVKIWNVDDGQLVATFTGHSGTVLALAFSADEKTLWTGAEDRTLREWRLP